MGALVDRLLPVHKIDHNEDQEVEHAAAEHIANGDVRFVGPGHGAYSGDEFRQRGDGSKQDQANPIAGDAGRR